jgi:hypothetical protein
MFPFGARVPPPNHPVAVYVPPPGKFDVTPVVGFKTRTFVAFNGAKYMFPFGARTPPLHPLAVYVAPPVKFDVTPVVGLRTRTFVAPTGPPPMSYAEYYKKYGGAD